MKCVVIYFSQTTNTEKIASTIQKGIKKASGHCDIKKIEDANPKQLYKYDLIGLGSPVWGAEPPNVKNFVNRMRFVGGKHVFAFCTHGGISDFFFPSIVPRLQSRGLIVIGTHDWYGNCSLYHHCDPYPTAGHPDKIDLQNAKEFGISIVERSQRIHSGEIELIPPVPSLPRPPDQETEVEGIKKIEMFPKLIKFHKEKCLYPECRLCMDNCPMTGIDLSVTPPIIAKPCANCEFCARICPTGALDIYNWLETMDTVSMMKSVILPELEKAEKSGRFRRLLPVEKIDYTLNYKRYKKHPQWVIGKGLNKP